MKHMSNSYCLKEAILIINYKIRVKFWYFSRHVM